MFYDRSGKAHGFVSGMKATTRVKGYLKNRLCSLL